MFYYLLVTALIELVIAQDNGRSGPPYRSFNSTPTQIDLVVKPEDPASLSPGYIFSAPRWPANTSFVPGPLIWDAATAEPIWDGTAPPYNFEQAMSFSTGKYNNQDVIALWQGQFFGAGYGNGYGLLLNQSYQIVANISTTIPDIGNDFHEFALTDNNTALIQIYKPEQYDLSAYGVQTTDGTQGWIINNYIQEIDIATGQAIFTWNALDHVDPTRGYADPGTTGTSQDNGWDFFHQNAIEKDSQGNYLISSRHFHAVYYLSPQGNIIWQMNGKDSNFTMEGDSGFFWQHDARWIEEGKRLSLFDNGASGWDVSEEQARGLILEINMGNMSVSVVQAYLPYTTETSPSQGSAQQQPNGDVIVGYGSQPWVSEYSSNGTVLWTGKFPGISQSYRSLRTDWVGLPTTSPSIAVQSSSSGQAQVYMSWNGATQVSNWTIHTSSSPDTSSSDNRTKVVRAGFETVQSVDMVSGGNTYIWAQGVGQDGTILGQSKVVEMKSDGSVSDAAPSAVVGATNNGGTSDTRQSGASRSGVVSMSGVGLAMILTAILGM